MTDRSIVTAFASAARTTTANSADITVGSQHRGFLAHLDITAASGTPTLDVKFQYKDTVSGKYTDMPGTTFAQQTGAATLTLLAYPGIGETANREVSVAVGMLVRAVATIGGTTPSFTFSLSVELLP